MSTLKWLMDLITHIIGTFLEIFVDGLLPGLFEWYFITPFAIDFPLVHNLWLYVRLLTAPFLLVGLFVSYYKFVRGDIGKNIVVTFLVALIFSGSSLYISDYFIFIGNGVTDAIINPVLVEAYKSEKSSLEIVQEGLKDEEINFNAFSPISVLKYSFGVSLKDENDLEDNEDDGNKNESDKTYEDNLNKVKASKNYPLVGNYKPIVSKVSEEELDENLYEIFLLENGGGGPIVCFIAMIEIAIMCMMAILRLMVLMLTIGMISLFITKDTFTGGNQELTSILILLIKTIAISFVFNLGWMASSILTRNEELVLIHPQYWAIIVYGIVIIFTYYFWVQQVINNIIKPSIDRIQNAQTQVRDGYSSARDKSKATYSKWTPQGVKNFANKVKGRFGGGFDESSAVAVSEKGPVIQNTSTLTNRQDYLNGLSAHERYQSDTNFFRNPAYDGKYKSSSGNFSDVNQDRNYNEELSCVVKNSR